MFKNKEGKLRSGWKILGLLISYYISLMGFFLIIDLIITFVITTKNFPTYDERKIAVTALYMNWTWFLVILQSVVTIGIVLFFWKVLTKNSVKSIGFPRLKGKEKEFGVGLGFGALSITIVFAFLVSIGNVHVVSWTPKITRGTFLFLLAFISVGFAEEILCRGYIMSALRQTKSKAVVIIGSSLIFSIMHIFNASFSFVPALNIFLIGLLLAYMVFKSGNIWMAIGFHITWNYFQGCVYGFFVSGINIEGIFQLEYGNDILNGGTFGPEGGLVVTGITLLGFLLVRWYFRNRNVK